MSLVDLCHLGDQLTCVLGSELESAYSLVSRSGPTIALLINQENAPQELLGLVSVLVTPQNQKRPRCHPNLSPSLTNKKMAASPLKQE